MRPHFLFMRWYKILTHRQSWAKYFMVWYVCVYFSLIKRVLLLGYIFLVWIQKWNVSFGVYGSFLKYLSDYKRKCKLWFFLLYLFILQIFFKYFNLKNSQNSSLVGLTTLRFFFIYPFFRYFNYPLHKKKTCFSCVLRVESLSHLWEIVGMY